MGIKTAENFSKTKLNSISETNLFQKHLNVQSFQFRNITLDQSSVEDLKTFNESHLAEKQNYRANGPSV